MGAGYLVLSLSLSYVAVFDYMLAWWYFAIMAAGGGIMFVLSFRKKVSV
ncbi:hypothetical protein [Lentibacillus sp. JNUCC-1]|nr:hypothetical protein [Lentibacillus sp. JNUCC-1]